MSHIARHRRRRGITQKVLAGRVGKSERWLVEVEAGRTDPRLHEIVALAGELRVEPAALTDHAVLVATPAVQRDQAAVAGMGTLFVERDEAELTYRDGIYRATMRRLLMNAGSTPVTRFLVRISVDRYPDDPARSNPLYREHPLTWDELGFSAKCGDEPMTWTVKVDRDALKELYLRFENGTGRQFPLYPNQSTWIEYSYTVSALKWGTWFQRAVRWPTRHLAVQLRFASSLGPVVWGTETSIAGEAFPLRTPIVEWAQDDEAVFEWGTENPPLHTRCRLEWRFRHDDQAE